MVLGKKFRTTLISLLSISIVALLGSVIFMWGTGYDGLSQGWFGAVLLLPHFYLLYLLLANKKIHKHFLAVNIAVILLALIGLLLFVPSLVDLWSGKSCTGFFGVHTNCLEHAKMRIFVFLYNPLIALSAVLLALLSFMLQVTSNKE